MRIEDYALIGDLHTAALVARNGSLEWLCVPRFDSSACFTALLGDERHGHWTISPAAEPTSTSRCYREGTLVLETTFESEGGTARLVDFMPIRGEVPTVVRVVEGVEGSVQMRMRLAARFDYGSRVPWVLDVEGGMASFTGPDALYLRTLVATHGEDSTIVADFSVHEGERVPFTLAWHTAHEEAPAAMDPFWALAATESWWREWTGRCAYRGEWWDEVVTSLRLLKALTYRPTGGIVAAPTTSLPESIGGERNWDYRYCWIRDAALTLHALMLGGYREEAEGFREWLLRAIAGPPSQSSIMYGLSGELWLPERTLDWLPGYEGSSPVRIGNAASDQFQLDIFGEIIDAAHYGWMLDEDVPRPELFAAVVVPTLEFVESKWREPDEGIWEVRGGRQQFTYSKVMAWVAFDRAIDAMERFGVQGGPLDHWRAIRAEIHEEVCREGYDPERRTFTQYYGSRELDASALLIPAVGFLPPSDERVVGTVAAIERELVRNGLVARYSTEAGSVDGLAGIEGAFLPCSFWLVDALALIGRTDDARALFERLLSLSNDVGLFSEEYDPEGQRMLGNFPQAFTHLALVNTASVLSGDPRLSPGRSVAARAGGEGDASTLEEPPASLPE